MISRRKICTGEFSAPLRKQIQNDNPFTSSAIYKNVSHYPKLGMAAEGDPKTDELVRLGASILFQLFNQVLQSLKAYYLPASPVSQGDILIRLHWPFNHKDYE